MQIQLGEYRFSETDVRRIVAEGVEVLDEFAPRHRAALGPRRHRVAVLLAGVDAWHEPIERVVPVLEQIWPELVGANDDLGGLLPATAVGSVVGLHRGNGGVPKLLASSVDVDHAGVVGDRQATRRHHGAPWQALCLWSEDVLASLASRGHPIAAGTAGENVTIAGLHWDDVVPGVRLRLGSVLCQISSYAVPCRQLARWFSDRRFDTIHHRNGPVSRLYATVLEPGAIATGDAAVLEP